MMAPPVCPPADEEAPLVCARAEEEALPREDDWAPSSDEEDPYAPPDEVARQTPQRRTGFGASFDLALWKALPQAEKARQVAFKKVVSGGACQAPGGLECPQGPQDRGGARSFGGRRIAVRRR